MKERVNVSGSQKAVGPWEPWKKRQSMPLSSNSLREVLRKDATMDGKLTRCWYASTGSVT
jgi:hypothetical protein